MPVREFACALLFAVAALAVPARVWAAGRVVQATPPAGAGRVAQATPPAGSGRVAQATPPAESGAPVGEPAALPAPPDIGAAPETGAPPAPAAPPPLPPALQSPGDSWDTAIVEAPEREPVARPRLSAAVGFGSSFDAVGFDDGNTRAIPAFFSELGIGDGPFGLNLLAFASEAAGRHENQNPVDRLAVDLYGVIRPGAWYRPDDRRYPLRVLHGLGAELGLGFERDGRSAISGTRFLVHTGARVDLPLTPAHEPTELRLRLAVRRGIGLYTPRLSGGRVPGVLEVDDSAVELYAALVVVF
jgi:hypothetical protein